MTNEHTGDHSQQRIERKVYEERLTVNRICRDLERKLSAVIDSHCRLVGLVTLFLLFGHESFDPFARREQLVENGRQDPLLLLGLQEGVSRWALGIVIGVEKVPVLPSHERRVAQVVGLHD